jgi:hypothetical protein
VNVLRNVHDSVVPHGLVLDIHPLGLDLAVRAGPRGLGFVDASQFAEVLDRMEDAVASIVCEGLLAEERRLRRHVVERFDTPEELLEEADGWENLRLPRAVRRRVACAEGPLELVDAVLYRLFRRD